MLKLLTAKNCVVTFLTAAVLASAHSVAASTITLSADGLLGSPCGVMHTGTDGTIGLNNGEAVLYDVGCTIETTNQGYVGVIAFGDYGGGGAAPSIGLDVEVNLGGVGIALLEMTLFGEVSGPTNALCPEGPCYQLTPKLDLSGGLYTNPLTGSFTVAEVNMHASDLFGGQGGVAFVGITEQTHQLMPEVIVSAFLPGDPIFTYGPTRYFMQIYAQVQGTGFADFLHTATLDLGLAPGQLFTLDNGIVITPSAVPEPSSLMLLATGVAALVAGRCKSTRRRNPSFRTLSVAGEQRPLETKNIFQSPS